MAEIIDVLRAEHRNIAKVLAILERQVDRMEAGERLDFDLVETIVDYFLDFPEAAHHPKEDIVFAAVEAGNAKAATAAMDLDKDHERVTAQLKQFARAVDNVLMEATVPRDVFIGAARTFIDEQRQHMRMEEEEFFPAALKALSEDEWSDIRGKLPREKDALFGGDVAVRYQELSEQIAAWELAAL